MLGCACRAFVDFSCPPSHACTMEKCDSSHLLSELKHEFIRINIYVTEII